MASYPVTKISCVANLFSRMMHFQKKGDKENGHSHVFNHLTLLAKGSLEVTVDGRTTVFNAPHMIYIRKDKLHELTALEDDTVAFCIHALRDGEGVDDILDPDGIPQGTDLLEIAKNIVRKPE
jgi:quercetin dioxygenase-like cupin family protein